MKRRIINLTVLSIMFVSLLPKMGRSQTVDNDFQLRTEAIIQKKLTNSIKINFTPEIRWDNTAAPDKYLFETSIEYKVVKGLSVEGGYRFIINPRDTKSTETFHRFAASTTYKKDIARFEPSIRLKYTNYTEDASSGDFGKIRAKVKYDIRDSKITPFISTEAFYNFTEGNLYKYRYGTGIKYKINKENTVGISYMLDYYLQEYRNKHVIGLSYKYAF